LNSQLCTFAAVIQFESGGHIIYGK